MSASNENNDRSNDIEEGQTTPLFGSSSPNTNHNLNEATAAVDNRSPSSTIAAAAAGNELEAANIPAAATGRVEIIDNDINDMPLTPSMIEAISHAAESDNANKQTGRVDIMDDGDNAPVPPAVLQESFNNAEDDMSGAAGKSNKQIHKVKISNDNEDEGPTHPTEFEDNYDDEDAIAKKKAKEEINNAEPDDLESVYDIPDMERDTIVRGVINTGDGTNNRRGLEDFEARARTDNNNAITICNDEEEGRTINNDVSDEDEGDTSDNEGIPLGDRSTVHIPEAFLVEDISVYDERTLYDATPILPWWKQRRMRVLLGVVFVIVAALVITLGVTLSSNNNNKNNPVQNVLILPSDAPSSSLVPTSSPTTCVHKITENAQVIDLQKELQIDSPYEPIVAVDGRNMVVVAKDEKYITEEDDDDDYGGDYDGPVFITFYSLDDEKWQRIQTPIRLENMGSLYEVDLSGTTAFVGFRYANDYDGIVLVYEQNQFGEWEKVEDEEKDTHSWFGWSVEIDGDLACVQDVLNINLYHREGNNKWVQFDTADYGARCSISGDTIAIYGYDSELGSDSIQLYKYNEDTKNMTPIQEPIPTGYVESMDLSNDYLVYWDTDEYDTVIYSQDDKNQTFTFHEQLNITGSEYKSPTLDNDLLVVGGGDNRTHIFSLQNDEWVETITLDQVFNDYQLSGRTLIATSEENEVYSFNIQDCMQAMPTQTPTISVAPTMTTLSPTSYWSTLQWSQQGLAITGDSADGVVGSSVAISGDGRTLVVGAPGKYDNNDRPGYVKVFYKQFDLSGWKWQLAETFTGNEVGDLFGKSVSMSEDGKTIAIGAVGDWNRPGYTRVYTRKNDKWVQLGEDIEGEALGDQSGGSVSLSSDGKTIAIGAGSNGGNGDYSGHVRVYTIVEGDGDSSNVTSWQQVGQDIDGEAEDDESGFSVSLSANGRTVAIGAYLNDGGRGDSGHVRVYNLVGDKWEQIGQDIDGENIQSYFGYSVSLSSDGRIVAVGAPGNNDNGYVSGKVKVYRLDSSEGDSKWVQIGQDLMGEAANDGAGGSVSLSSDGKTLAIGANQYGNDSSGYVRVYRLVGSDDSWTWTQVGKNINGVNAGDRAGWSVAISSDGNVVVMGSPYNDDNGEDSGHVRVFAV